MDVVPEDGGENLVSDLEFPNASNYVGVPAGTSQDVSDYAVITKAKGTEPWPLHKPHTSLKSDTVYSAFVVGNAAAENFQVIVTVDNSTTAIRDTAMAVPDTGGISLVALLYTGAILTLGCAGVLFALCHSRFH